MISFVDANCFKAYIDAIILEKTSTCSAAVQCIKENGVIMLDVDGLFVQEWRACTGGYGNIFVGDHIAEMMQAGHITLHKFSRNNQLRKALRQLGVPTKDARIVEFASGAGCEMVVTNDIDFYEPTRKGCNSKLHKKLVHDRLGSVCRYIEKKIGIITCCCCKVQSFF